MDTTPPPNIPDNDGQPGMEARRQNFWNKFNLSAKWIVLLVAVVIILLGALVWMTVTRSMQPEQPQIKIWFDTPAVVKSGSITELTLVYENHDNQNVQDVMLEISYPDGFQFIKSTPDPRSGTGQVFDLPDLPASGTGKVMLSGIFTGSPQEVKSVKATLFYKLKNYNDSFSSSSQADVSLEASNITLNVSAPGQHVMSQRIEYVIGYQNVSDKALDRVQIRVEYPTGFEFTSAVPASEDHKTWSASTLNVGDSGELRIIGNLSGTPGEDKVLTVTLGFMDGSGTFVLQNKAYSLTRITDSPMTVSMRLEEKQEILDEGEGLRYQITYENSGQQGMRNVRIVLHLDGEAFDLSSLQAEGGALVGKDIIWNAVGQRALELLQPGQKGEFKAQVLVRKDLIKSQVKNPVANAKISIRSDELPQEVYGNEIRTVVRTTLTCNPSIIYVSGANPPKAGQETVYKVTLKAGNTLNDVKDLQWSLFLNSLQMQLVDDSVVPENQKDALSLNVSSGRLAWRIGSLGAFGIAQVEFLLKVTPSVADVGKAMVILKDNSLTAKDTFSESDVETSIPDVNLELKVVN